MDRRFAEQETITSLAVNLEINAIDIISNDINLTGNLAGSYNDLAELMVLSGWGKVKLNTSICKL